MGIDNNINILSMNVRGLFSNKKKRLDVFDWAKGKHASIICFQETHSSKDVEKIWEEEWGNTCIFCHHNNRSAGVSIMFKKGLDFTIHDTKFDQNGRYIVIDITLFEQRLTLVCLYGYNTDEPLLFDDILYKIALYANTSILLCGDWNVVQDCNLDTYNILHKRNPKSREKIEEIIEKLELLDPWRTCHPTDRKFTWRQPSPIKQSRLDYFLVTEDIYSLMKNTKIIPGYKTDHSAIVFTFSASLAKRGKGYWKFNSQLVRDVEYVKKIKTCIKDTISEYYLSGDIQNCLDVKLTCNDQLFFEILKMKIRTLSISYSIGKNREDREHTSKLEKEVEQLENIMNMSPNVNVQATLYGKKLELENKREQKIEGLLLRSRANWHENGEKCSEYFCKLEKSNFIKKTMAELIDDQGKHISEQSSILFEQQKFYKTLYSSRRSDREDNSFYNHNVKLTQEQSDLCEGNLTFDECALALKHMTNGKSPGSDGFTVDFYKFFWRDLGPFVYRSLYFGYEHRNFSSFQYQSVITCLPKDGKDRRYMSNWRPISLLNTDIKIASAAIANRLKPVLPFIISDTQNGFIKDRFIGENIRLLYDLMHYLEEHNMTGLLLLVDFEKAFDSVEWDFIVKALKSFNFGPSICKWFETLYSEAKSCVINNGNLSSFFNLERGCRQGDPLSPYLFIIGVELLALKLKSTSDIHGIPIHNKELLLSQYADDTFLVLDGKEKSLEETLKCFDSFHRVSGLKMNASKTKAVWIGTKKYSDHILCPNYNLQWTKSNFKLLGIDFSLDLQAMLDINFTKKIKEMSSILKAWEHRKLTLLGKITVVKTLALPKIVHLLTALPNLSQIKIKEFNTLFYNFIWNGKLERIKRNTLIGDFMQGGLNMVHLSSFSTYLKISWVRRLLLNLEGSWQTLLLSELTKFGGDRVFSLQKEKLLEVHGYVKNPFWKDVLFCLHTAKPYTKACTNDILSLDILNFVPLSDYTIYMQWKDFGVQYIKDLVNCQNKEFFTFEKIRHKILTNNFLKYYSLISNIPKFIKDHIKEYCGSQQIENVKISDAFCTQIINNKKPKFVYKSLIDHIFQPPLEKFQKWEQLLDSEIENWQTYFMLLRKSCKDTYLKSFQYKILHQIIPTNSFLYKIKKKDSSSCTFCKLDDETIVHFFYDCPITYQFWSSLLQQIRLYSRDFAISKKQIFLGFYSESLFMNLLFIVAKNYIYKCKFKELTPNIFGFKNRIKQYQSYEYYIA